MANSAGFALAAQPLEDVLGEVLTAHESGDHPEIFALAPALAARTWVAEADAARLRVELGIAQAALCLAYARRGVVSGGR